MRQERVVDLVADGDGDGGEIEAARRKLRDLEDERRRLRGELDAARAAVSSEDAVAAAIGRSLEHVASVLRGAPVAARDVLSALLGGEPLRVVRAGAPFAGFLTSLRPA